MAGSFYVKIGGKGYGPFDGDKLRRLAAAGKISRDDTISRDGQTGWTPAANVQGLFPPAELILGDEPASIPTVVRHAQPPAIAAPPIPIDYAQPAAPQQPPTIVYMQAPSPAPVQQPVMQQNTTVVVHAAKPGNSAAALAALLGIGSLVFAFVPFLGLFVIPLAGLTLLLAALGFLLALTRGGQGLVGSLGGGVLALIAIPISVASSAVGTGAAIGLSGEALERSRQAAAEAQAKHSPAQTVEASKPVVANPKSTRPATAVVARPAGSTPAKSEESEASKSLTRERATLADLEAELESNRQKIESARAMHAKVESDLATRVQMGKRTPDDLARAKTHTQEFETRSEKLLAKLIAALEAQQVVVARAEAAAFPAK